MIYDKNNVFAKIIRGEISVEKIFEDENIIAFHDISKAAPTHALVIPKGEFVNFSHFVANEKSKKIADFFQKVAMIANMLDLEESGFRIISNIGFDASQSVPHFHVHILGKKKLGALVSGDINH